MAQEQVEAFAEMERLLSGARRSASLAFPKGDVRHRNEFQVGVHEPDDFASVIERAHKVLAACQTHADALDDHGWLDEDTTALDAVIDLIDGGDNQHEAAKDKKNISPKWWRVFPPLPCFSTRAKTLKPAGKSAEKSVL